MTHKTESKIIEQIESHWPFSEKPKRIVVKIGSNVMSTSEGLLDRNRLKTIARQLSQIKKMGTEILVISSGAVAAGMGEMETKVRPTALPQLQGMAAIGQSELMSAWREGFREDHLHVAQVLLSRSDLDDRERFLNAQYTLDALLGMGVIPIVNENDTVATEELTFGDNDMLSAIIAATIGAGLLLIMTDIDGLYTANPKTNEDAQFIPIIESITPDIEALAGGTGSHISRGGMMTKLAAAKHACSFGVTTVLARGTVDDQPTRVMSGKFYGTMFLPLKPAKAGKARLRWISMKKPHGTITIDEGAVRAIVQQSKSLLPVGIKKVTGNFKPGDIIKIIDLKNNDIGQGMTSFSSDDLNLLSGKRQEDFEKILGHDPQYGEAIHRNYLYVIPHNHKEE